MNKSSKNLSPEWKRYLSSIREIQKIIDENNRPWWKRLLAVFKKAN